MAVCWDTTYNYFDTVGLRSQTWTSKRSSGWLLRAIDCSSVPWVPEMRLRRKGLQLEVAPIDLTPWWVAAQLLVWSGNELCTSCREWWPTWSSSSCCELPALGLGSIGRRRRRRILDPPLVAGRDSEQRATRLCGEAGAGVATDRS